MKLFVLLLIISFNTASNTILKNGPCPNGYHQNGQYCVGDNVAPAIEKIGPCPSGYHQNGAYCLGNSSDSAPVIEKIGPCPSDYHQSGAYCKKSR